MTDHDWGLSYPSPCPFSLLLLFVFGFCLHSSLIVLRLSLPLGQEQPILTGRTLFFLRMSAISFNKRICSRIWVGSISFVPVVLVRKVVH